MQIHCHRFWITLIPFFLAIALLAIAIAGYSAYKYGHYAGKRQAYPEGWFDRHMRDDFAKTVVCGQYWKYIEALCRSDQAKREKSWE